MTKSLDLDRERQTEFAQHLFGVYTNGLLTYMIDLGYRTGLFEAAAQGPATAQQLADRAGLQERYVREWLGSITANGIMTYDAGTREYTLPAEHAAGLTGSGSANMAPLAGMVTSLGKNLGELEHVFRVGGGVPYSVFRPEFTDKMDQLSRRPVDEMLLDRWLPAAPGLSEQLAAGVRVADIGTGTGHALIVLGAAFPASTFVGYDIAEDALDRGRAEAAEAKVSNVTFEVADVAELKPAQPFDVIFAFDSVHDQAAPATVLRAAHDALVPGGTFFMLDLALSSNLEDNLGNPNAGWIYSISTLHCMTVSLAEGGAGLGSAWGEQTARWMLGEAGFGEVVTHPAPGNQRNMIYVTHRPA
jgi:SAM-dependent methyltransferase